MAKITKTKSGKYHTYVFLGRDYLGKPIMKSITAPTIKEVKILVAKAIVEEPETYTDMTVQDAYKRYINSKYNTLSPSTRREYRAAAGRDFPLLLPMKLSQLNNTLIQQAVNEISAYNAPHTVRNKYYLLKPVLNAYRPDLKLNIRLPQQIIMQDDDYLPTYEDVHTLLESADDHILVPILLAAFGGLRTSEICALTPNDFTDVSVSITKAKVKGEFGFEVKPPKTKKGFRTTPLAPALIKECKQWKYFDVSPNTLGNQFRRLRDRCGIPIHFHMLRHFYAATLIDAGIDFMTIMTYGGWESLEMITKIYAYMMKSKKKDAKIISIYSKFTTPKKVRVIS